jgi:hypothetical protein
MVYSWLLTDREHPEDTLLANAVIRIREMVPMRNRMMGRLSICKRRELPGRYIFGLQE